MHKETQETKITPAAALTWPGQSEPLSYPGLLLMPAASACLTPPQAGPRPRRWACGGGGLGSGAQGAGQRLPRGLARRRRRAHKLPCPALPCCAGGSLRFCHLGRRPLLPHQHRHSERERPGRPRLPCQWVFAHWGWVGGRAGQRRCSAHMGARPRQGGAERARGTLPMRKGMHACAWGCRGGTRCGGAPPLPPNGRARPALLRRRSCAGCCPSAWRCRTPGKRALASASTRPATPP